MSSQLIGLSGQPSASAIGRHIAKPMGASTLASHVFGIRSFPLRSRQMVFASSIQDWSPGLQTTGLLVPLRIACCDPPDVTCLTVTKMTSPEATLCCSALNWATTAFIQSSLVLEDEISMAMEFAGGAAVASAAGVFADVPCSICEMRGNNNTPTIIQPNKRTASVTTIALPDTFGFSE